MIQFPDEQAAALTARAAHGLTLEDWLGKPYPISGCFFVTEVS